MIHPSELLPLKANTHNFLPSLSFSLSLGSDLVGGIFIVPCQVCVLGTLVQQRQDEVLVAQLSLSSISIKN